MKNTWVQMSFAGIVAIGAVGCSSASHIYYSRGCGCGCDDCTVEVLRDSRIMDRLIWHPGRCDASGTCPCVCAHPNERERRMWHPAAILPRTNEVSLSGNAKSAEPNPCANKQERDTK